MGGKIGKLSIVAVLFVLILFPELCLALITGEHGNRPIQDRGWPTGSVEVANLESRLGYWEGPPFGGGEYQFLYRCKNTDEFNRALKILSAIQAKRLELVVHNGPEYSFWLKDNDEELSEEDNRVDWTFTVWNPASWDRLYNSPRGYMLHSDHPNFKKPVAAPKIDVYIGGGSILWKNVKVPKNVLVIDTRPGSVSPEFAGSGLVHGKVLDMATAEPIAGAQVVLAEHEGHGKWKDVMHGKTDEKGFCQIAKVPPGYYEVQVRAKDYAPRKQGGYNNTRPEYYEFEVRLARPSYVKGTVTNLRGNPIEGVKVLATNTLGPDGLGYPCAGDTSAITDEQGRFEIDSLPAGGLMTGRCRAESLHLTNSIFEQYPIPSDEIKLTMTGTGTVRGKVVTQGGKRPDGQIVLELKPPGENQSGKWGYSGYLSEDGTFDITGIPPGEYVISTRPNPCRADYAPNTKKITVKPGKTYELEIVHAEQ